MTLRGKRGEGRRGEGAELYATFTCNHPTQSQMEVVRDECERKILSFSEEEKRGGCVVRDEGVRSGGVRVMCLLQERLKWTKRINA